jgi:hypothetical protein
MITTNIAAVDRCVVHIVRAKGNGSVAHRCGRYRCLKHWQRWFGEYAGEFDAHADNLGRLIGLGEAVGALVFEVESLTQGCCLVGVKRGGVEWNRQLKVLSGITQIDRPCRLLISWDDALIAKPLFGAHLQRSARSIKSLRRIGIEAGQRGLHEIRYQIGSE